MFAKGCFPLLLSCVVAEVKKEKAQAVETEKILRLRPSADNLLYTRALLQSRRRSRGAAQRGKNRLRRPLGVKQRLALHFEESRIAGVLNSIESRSRSLESLEQYAKFKSKVAQPLRKTLNLPNKQITVAMVISMGLWAMVRQAADAPQKMDWVAAATTLDLRWMDYCRSSR